MSWWTHRTPQLLQRLFPHRTWKRDTDDNRIYLTFDDGPQSDLTRFLMSELNRVRARATFFIIGEYAAKDPELVKELISAGHSIGNHTYSHLNGWKTKKATYLEDFEKCEEVLMSIDHSARSRLFRPPYGRITSSQAQVIRKSHEIIMWDILSGDFDLSLDINNAKKQLVKNVKPGSIVVFHDNIRFVTNLKALFPWFLDHYCERGFKFEPL